MHRAFKYRFYPTAEQENLLRRTIGCARLVYNKALAMRSDAWNTESIKVSYNDTSKSLTQWKKEDDLNFLNEVPAVPLQQALRHLQSAYANFFAKRANYPRFKRKSDQNSIKFTSCSFRYRNGELYIAKSKEPLNIRWSRQIPAGCRPTTVTISLAPSGRWSVSILVNDHTIQPLPKVNKCIGIDVGLTHYLTTSDGDKVDHPKYFDRYKARLKRAQRRLSRKVKGSNNRYKARLKVARIHQKITDCRLDFLHKLTTKLIQENQLISVEDLCVKGMLRNRKLSRSIADSAWSTFVQLLAYKAQWYGRTLVKVGRFFPSSKTCSHCDYKVDSLPLSIREWTCPNCGTNHDRDINAAKNIMAAGLVASVCGATVRPKPMIGRGKCDEAETLSCEA
jgi:putative transposase